MNKTLLAGAAAALMGLAGSAQAAVVTLLNIDPPGVGLNATAPAMPVGNNPGKTVGEQRRIAYQFAMDLWGSVLQSEVEIKIYASFAPLSCTATGGTLASAGTYYIFINTPNTRPNTIYHSALADALAGVDLADDPEDPGDIVSRFNGNLGQPGCLEGTRWYYGLDGKTPPGTINFLNVVMHEIGHGLGMSGFLNKTTGALYAGYPDIYTAQAYDNGTGKSFVGATTTSAERSAAMRTPGRTVWTGPAVNSQAALVLDTGRQMLRVTAPAGAAGSYEIGRAQFGPAVNVGTFGSAPMALVDDGATPVAGSTATDGCETPFANAADVAGKVAVIDRGTCSFAIKVRNAQANGAVGVVVVNNVAGVQDMANAAPPITDITIPAVLISNSDGARIKANPGATGSVVFDSTMLNGADSAGRVRLYSPTVVAGGSTFSHFDTALSPNALMEPFDTPEIQSQYNIDLTPAAFEDIGWTLNPGGARIGKCDTTVDAVADGGLIIGANVAAYSAVCRVKAAGDRTKYVRCLSDRGLEMNQQGLITRTQSQTIFKCASLNQ